jgi:hypothetical protein
MSAGTCRVTVLRIKYKGAGEISIIAMTIFIMQKYVHNDNKAPKQIKKLQKY